MTLDLNQAATLRAELRGPDYAGLDDLARFVKVNTPGRAPNPEPAPQRPRPFTAMDVQALLSEESLSKFLALPVAARILDAMDRGDRTSTGRYATALAKGGTRATITGPERDAILALLGATGPDAGWPAQINVASGKDRLFGGATWRLTTGETVDFVPMPDISEARS